MTNDGYLLLYYSTNTSYLLLYYSTNTSYFGGSFQDFVKENVNFYVYIYIWSLPYHLCKIFVYVIPLGKYNNHQEINYNNL